MNKRDFKFRVRDLQKNKFIDYSDQIFPCFNILENRLDFRVIGAPSLNPDRFVVNQYIGFADSKRELIFEGDILKFELPKDYKMAEYLNSTPKMVQYGDFDGCAAYYVINTDPADQESGEQFNSRFCEYCEIIGNVYEKYNTEDAPMIGDNYYITFEDKSIYQIKDAMIRFYPNQKKNDNKIKNGVNHYILFFKNNLDKDILIKFNKQNFVLGDINFKLMSYNDRITECWADSI